MDPLELRRSSQNGDQHGVWVAPRFEHDLVVDVDPLRPHHAAKIIRKHLQPGACLPVFPFAIRRQDGRDAIMRETTPNLPTIFSRT